MRDTFRQAAGLAVAGTRRLAGGTGKDMSAVKDMNSAGTVVEDYSGPPSVIGGAEGFEAAAAQTDAEQARDRICAVADYRLPPLAERAERRPLTRCCSRRVYQPVVGNPRLCDEVEARAHSLHLEESTATTSTNCRLRDPTVSSAGFGVRAALRKSKGMSETGRASPGARIRLMNS